MTSYFRTRSFYPKCLYPKLVELKICLDPTFFWIKSFLNQNVFEPCLDQTFLTQFFFRIQHFHLFSIKGLASPRTPPFQTCKKSGTWEPSSQTFLEEIWTFFRYQRFKEINLKFGCGFVKTWSNKSHFHYILT